MESASKLLSQCRAGPLSFSGRYLMACKSSPRASVWHERLDERHVKYAVKDAYTSYKMYRRIVDMRNCLLPYPDERSSQMAVAGASQEVDD